MARPASPIFLERARYRRRRLLDAAKLLPVLGVVLLLVPLLWPNDLLSFSESVSTASALIYLFVVWVGLIGVSFAMWWIMRRAAQDSPQNSAPAERD